jgi:glycosidase
MQLPLDSAYERLANGFAILATNKGAPLIYYGDEIGLPGAGDPDNRRMMTWTGWSASQTTLRSRIQKLLRIRADHPATRYGARTTLNATADVWVYSRVYKSDKIYVVVNRGDAPAQVTLPSGSLTELLAGTKDAGPAVTVPPRQTRIYSAM